MTDAELSALETAAKAATPGPWRHPGRALVVSRMSADEPLVCDCLSREFAQAPKDAAFIAAANPAVVLELIAELRQTREVAKVSYGMIRDAVDRVAAKEATCQK